jgi:hypothetical protein
MHLPTCEQHVQPSAPQHFGSDAKVITHQPARQSMITHEPNNDAHIHTPPPEAYSTNAKNSHHKLTSMLPNAEDPSIRDKATVNDTAVRPCIEVDPLAESPAHQTTSMATISELFLNQHQTFTNYILTNTCLTPVFCTTGGPTYTLTDLCTERNNWPYYNYTATVSFSQFSRYPVSPVCKPPQMNAINFPPYPDPQQGGSIHSQ